MPCPDVVNALADGLRQSGCDLCTNHPGFYSQQLAALLGCEVTSRSERAAFATAWGASLVGHRAVVTFKNLGLNDAADPFVNAAFVGCHGGLVCVVFDDIDIEQSQLQLDCRFYRSAGDALWLEPTSIHDAYRWAARAFELSETFETMVVIRITNLLLHACGPHTRENVAPQPRLAFSRVPGRWVMHPANVQSLTDNRTRRLARLKEWSDSEPIAACMPNDDEEFSVLVGAQPPGEPPPGAWARLDRYPIPSRILQAVARASCTAVHEHGDGNARLAILSATQGATVLSYPLAVSNPNREYHSRDWYEPLYAAIRQLDARVVIGDIGSYTMDPAQTLDACLCYGGSVAVAAGAAAAAPESRVVCVTGDGGFSHSGREGLAEAVDRRVTLVIFVIDNGGCRDTGGQAVSIDWPEPRKGLRVEQLNISPATPLTVEQLESWLNAGGVTLVRATVELPSERPA